MQFRTVAEPSPIGRKIEPGETIFSIGSCFAENMAARLRDGGFSVTSNPFGVLYNPASIALALEQISSGREFKLQDLAPRDDVWCSPFFHGSFSGPSPAEVLAKMNSAARAARRALERATVVIVSFGTPWIFTLSERFSGKYRSFQAGTVVANCHKFPADHFEWRRMEIGEIADRFTELTNGPLKGKRLILTVSPVRYIKEGLHGSNLGKAVLLLAAERICDRVPGAWYFPAYEALTDDLRDYRFYDTDMIHPSQTAVDYIWEMFREHAMTGQAASQAVEVGKLTAATRHRVLNPGTRRHREHLEAMLGKVEALRVRFPAAELTGTEEFFRKQLCDLPENR